jgi:hypothetical protein
VKNQTRPIFHKVDETIRGHLSCSFLVLVLVLKKGQEVIAAPRSQGLLASILADLDALTETNVERTTNASCCARHRVPPPVSRSPVTGVAPTVPQVN